MSKVFGKAVLLLAALAVVFMLSACNKSGKEQGPGGELMPVFSQQADLMENSLKSDPKNASLLIQLGNLYYDWGEAENSKPGGNPMVKWSAAVDYYRRALDIEPNNVDVRVDMANLLRYMNRAQDAVTEYRQAIKINPKHPQARINLVLTLGEDRKDKKAMEKEYEDLLKAIPEQKSNLALKQQVDTLKGQSGGASK